MTKYIKEIIILLLAITVVFFATKTYRLTQILDYQNQITVLQAQITQQNQFIQSTRNALIRSNLNPGMVKGFNQLGWNIPIKEQK